MLDTVRPELERDGGDIRMLEFRDKVLRIEMLGACKACWMADMVMMRYLESLVRTHVGEDIFIENVQQVV